MAELKAGFARIDITPSLGVTMAGYPEVRHADGILDPLLATAVAFDNGAERAVVLSLDLVGMNMALMAQLRSQIAAAVGTSMEGVFIHCTHTHTGPTVAEDTASLETENREYMVHLRKKLQDVAVLAVQDLKPAKMFYTHGQVKDVAFVRRFLLKNGKYRTNPGFQCPDVVRAMGEPDEMSSLVIIKRENAPEIGIVHFQVHPDVIGGTKFSADYPKFVRDTYEQLVDNSRCMYINGAQGDTNHVDIRLGEDDCRKGYERSRYMGRKIAMSVVANYPLAKPLDGSQISYAQKSIFVKYNKGRPEQMEDALYTMKVFEEKGREAALPRNTGVKNIRSFWEARRILSLANCPDEKELLVTSLRIGQVAFAGFPGEPFTDIGRAIKANSKFTLTLPVCVANGYEGYYPMLSVYSEGGYEFNTARYVAGVAEALIEASSEIVNAL